MALLISFLKYTLVEDISTDFLVTSVKSGLNTVRLTLRLTTICSELNLGQLWASYDSLFQSKSLKRSGKSLVVV